MDFVRFWRRRRQAILSAFAFCLGGVLSAATASAQADSDAVQLLDQFASDVEALTARFEQLEVTVDGDAVRSSGTFKLLRPDRFSWHYDPPSELIVVADGETLWTYDVEFALVTTSPLSDLAASPAMLLSGGGDVRETFDVYAISSEDALSWLELIPRVDSGDFSSIKIAFDDGVPVVLELIDGLSNLTHVAFFEVDADADLRNRDFEFEPPDGVDVFGDYDE